MKEFYPAILALLILMMPVAAERNQSVAVSKKIKFTSLSDLNLYCLRRLK
ncbi:hypothetical protein [uncultured Campylobacter sp.]|nr:hypothetical protein [uncultured Campylobacter sp.]